MSIAMNLSPFVEIALLNSILMRSNSAVGVPTSSGKLMLLQPATALNLFGSLLSDMMLHTKYYSIVLFQREVTNS